MTQDLASQACFVESITRNYVERGLVNRVVVTDLSSEGAFSRQHYVEGMFDLAEDEALIYATEAPECRYRNIQVTDTKWVTLNYINRQTSFNGRTGAQLRHCW